MLTGALVVKNNFPVIGDFPDVFAWILVVLASIGTIYALYPFFKPAFPEIKKISCPLPERAFCHGAGKYDSFRKAGNRI